MKALFMRYEIRKTWG